MKELTKERTITQKYTVYQAVDGTEFNSREECEKYDNSAKGVLRGRLKEFVVTDKYDCRELFRGYEDNKCLALAVPTEEAIYVILHAYFLDRPWILEERNAESKERVEKAVRQAYENNDIVLFGLNCGDEMYFIDTRMNIINRLNSLDKNEEGKS